MHSAFQVFVNDKHLSAFKRRAIRHYKAGKGEYLEALFVQRGVGEFHIRSFELVQISYSDKETVAYEKETWDVLKAKCAARNLEMGSIHTHPSLYGTQPSKEDYTSIDGDVLMGICEIYDSDYVGCPQCSPAVAPGKSRKIKTTIDFWLPQKPLELLIVKQ